MLSRFSYYIYEGSWDENLQRKPKAVFILRAQPHSVGMDCIDFELYGSSELLQAEFHIRNYHHESHMKPLALRCAIELGIPDLLQNHGQPITPSELVSSLQIHPSKTHCFYRLLRMLVCTGFFSEQEEKYSLTLASRLLPKENWSTETIPTAISSVNVPYLKPMLSLSTWLKNSDKTVLETAHQNNFWDTANPNAKMSTMFIEMMATDSRVIATVMLRECREVFQGVDSLVDVGGGTGTMAKAIANAFPHMKCTVLDLPHIVAGLQGTKNLDFVGGSMFEAIPPANAILLKVCI